MGNQAFNALRGSLLDSGIAPRHVRRLVLELQDHLDDLRAEATADGCDSVAARRRALRRIGDQQLLAMKIAGMTELRTWAYRYPRIARVYYPLAYVLLLPAAPLIAGAARAPILARWGAALLLSATVTGAMLLGMQLSIAFG